MQTRSKRRKLNKTKQRIPSIIQHQTGMEDFFLKFSHLTENIFDQLEDISLAKCQIVSQSWHDYLDQNKLLHIRMIQSNVRKFHEVGESWEIAFNKMNTKNIMELGIAVKKIYTDESKKAFADLTFLTPLLH